MKNIKGIFILIATLTIMLLIMVIGYKIIVKPESEGEIAVNAQAAFEAFLENEGYIEYYVKDPTYGGFPELWYREDIRYTLEDLDGDEINELFVSRGNSHIDGVLLFRYDENKEVVYLGSFSSFGSVSIQPSQSMIIAMYGSMGVYHHVYIKVADGQLLLQDITMINGAGEEPLYYINFPAMELNEYGSLTSYPDIEKAERVAEEEYLTHCQIYEGKNISISYDNMVPVK